MKRLRRWLFILSLLLSAATSALWPLSYWYRGSTTLFTPTGRCYTLCSYRGGVFFWSEMGINAWKWGAWSNPTKPHPLLDGLTFNFLGVGYSRYVRPTAIDTYILRLPDSMLIIAFAAAACLFRPKPQRGEAGLCPVCGYDLRATPRRCPECGTVPNAM